MKRLAYEGAGKATFLNQYAILELVVFRGAGSSAPHYPKIAKRKLQKKSNCGRTFRYSTMRGGEKRVERAMIWKKMTRDGGGHEESGESLAFFRRVSWVGIFQAEERGSFTYKVELCNIELGL